MDENSDAMKAFLQEIEKGKEQLDAFFCLTKVIEILEKAGKAKENGASEAEVEEHLNEALQQVTSYGDQRVMRAMNQ